MAAIGATMLALSLSACSEALPDTVAPGTTVSVAWGDELTSTNAAASPTPGNLDIAAVTRDGFGEVIDGEFVANESFGKVSIVSESPFVARFDLAEPDWSDGIPLDAADLMLGWAASAGLLAHNDQAADPLEGATVTAIDEFARSVDITFRQATSDWQQAVSVPVPAHVVGQLAFDIDDEMVAKQSVITAIQNRDETALSKIAKVWNNGFTLNRAGTTPAPPLSSGPFRVDEVSTSTEGQTVVLMPNAHYRGATTPKVARVKLLPAGDAPVSKVGDGFDVLQFSPASSDADIVSYLQRRDVTVTTTHDGTLWGVYVSPNGVFTSKPARTAFLRGLPVEEIVQGGAQGWSSSYQATTSFVASPGSRAYGIVEQDAGALGSAGSDAAMERESAGIAAKAPVCVLYDRASEFASGAYAALRDSATAAGWGISDCSSPDFKETLADRQWDVVIARTDIAQTVTQLEDQWGSGGQQAIVDTANAGRDTLIADLARTVDVYEAREIRARIEAAIVQDAVALPLAMSPRITLADKTVSGVTPRNGAVATLTYSMVQWETAT